MTGRVTRKHSAVVGAACTQNGGRDTYGRIHVLRTKAAREAL